MTGVGISVDEDVFVFFFGREEFLLRQTGTRGAWKREVTVYLWKTM